MCQQDNISLGTIKYSVDYSPSGKSIVSGSSDKTVRIWNSKSFKQIEILNMHTDWVTTVQYSPDGQLIASAGFDMSIRLWSSDGMFVGNLLGHTQPICSIKFRSDGLQLISAGFDQVIRQWDIKKKRLISLIPQNTGCITSISYSPDDSMIASAAQDVYLWNIKSQSVVSKIPVNDKINSVTFAGDGKQIIISVDSSIMIFDVDTVKSITQLSYHQQRIRSVYAIKDTQDIISCCVGKQIILKQELPFLKVNQNISNEQPVSITNEKPLIIKAGNEIQTIALSPDGKYIASAGGDIDFSIKIWSLNTGKQVGKGMKGHQAMILSVNYSKDGNTLISGGWDTTIRQWNVQTQKQIGQINAHKGWVFEVQYSPDQNYIVSCSRDACIKFFDSKTSQEHKDKEIKTDMDNSIVCLSLSPIQNVVAFGDLSGWLRRQAYNKNVQYGQEVKAHSGSLKSVKYSADGRLIITCSDSDTSIIIWDAITIQKIVSCLGHNGFVESINFSPDMYMNYLISGGQDRTVRIWDRYTGKQIGQSLTYHKVSVGSTQFSHDGKFIITGGADEQIRIMVTPIELGLERLC